jgi:hypothetical protein
MGIVGRILIDLGAERPPAARVAAIVAELLDRGLVAGEVVIATGDDVRHKASPYERPHELRWGPLTALYQGRDKAAILDAVHTAWHGDADFPVGFQHLDDEGKDAPIDANLDGSWLARALGDVSRIAVGAS